MITQASYTITVAASLTATPGTTCPTCCLLNQQTPESASDVTQPSYDFTCGPQGHKRCTPAAEDSQEEASGDPAGAFATRQMAGREVLGALGVT